MPGDVEFNLVKKKADVLPLVPLTAHKNKNTQIQSNDAYTQTTVPTSQDAIVNYTHSRVSASHYIITRWVGWYQ